jgi:hypothetical protein
MERRDSAYRRRAGWPIPTRAFACSEWRSWLPSAYRRLGSGRAVEGHRFDELKLVGRGRASCPSFADDEPRRRFATFFSSDHTPPPAETYPRRIAQRVKKELTAGPITEFGVGAALRPPRFATHSRLIAFLQIFQTNADVAFALRSAGVSEVQFRLSLDRRREHHRDEGKRPDSSHRAKHLQSPGRIVGRNLRNYGTPCKR